MSWIVKGSVTPLLSVQVLLKSREPLRATCDSATQIT